MPGSFSALRDRRVAGIDDRLDLVLVARRDGVSAAISSYWSLERRDGHLGEELLEFFSLAGGRPSGKRFCASALI